MLVLVLHREPWSAKRQELENFAPYISTKRISYNYKILSPDKLTVT